ncbi:MAG: endonuclease [Caldisericota bacterium]|nr:endonuclease [Caldisericota bacterium]
MQKNILNVFQLLRNEFGIQNWWPAETPFEVMVGAVLTQQTSWKNVEKAINSLKEKGVLTPSSFNKMPLERIKQLIKPAGFYNIKSERLKVLTEYFIKQYSGSISQMQKTTVSNLRKELLSIRGIGKETADSILLYALNKKIFVVDTYTIRMAHRTDILNSTDYDEIRKIFETNLKKHKINGYSAVDVFKEMHALIVELGKRYCKKIPICNECPLNKMCKKKGV